MQNACKFAKCKFGFVLFVLLKKVISNFSLISISRDSYKDRVEGSLNYKPRKKEVREW